MDSENDECEDRNAVNKTLASGEEDTAPELGNNIETVRQCKRRWTVAENQMVMECYLKSKPEKRGWSKRMYEIWKERNLFELTKAQLSSQLYQIRKNKCVSHVGSGTLVQQNMDADTQPLSSNLQSVSSGSLSVSDEPSTSQPQLPNVETENVVPDFSTSSSVTCSICNIPLRSNRALSMHNRHHHPTQVLRDIRESSGVTDVTQSANDSQTDERIEFLQKTFLPQLTTLEILARKERNIHGHEENFNKIYGDFIKKLNEYQPEFFPRKGKRKRRSTIREDAVNKARREKFERKKAQFNFFNDPKKLLQQVMDFSNKNNSKDPASFSSEEMHTYFSELLSQGKVTTVDPEFLPPPMSVDSLNALRLEEESFEKTHPTITPDNILPILRKTTNRTSPGSDGIRPSTYKQYDPEAKIISKICSIAYLTHCFPSSWCIASVFLLQKEEKDPIELKNRRPIAVFPFLRRLYSKVIVALVNPFVTDLLHPSQRGFQPGRGCVENVYKLRQIIQLAKSNKKQCVIVSFDAKNAFNSVSMAHRSECLSSLPVPHHLKTAFLNLFEKSDIQVKHGSQITKVIKVKDGVPQGEPASPLAFNLCLNFILQHLHKTFKGKGVALNDTEESIALCFADDLVITAGSLEGAVEMSSRLNFLLNKIGLELNQSKCKAFAMNIPDIPDILSPNLRIGFLDDDDMLKYLGAEVRVEGKSSHKKIKDLVCLRCEALLNFPHLHNWQKLSVCRMFITSLLPYPAQTDFNLDVCKSPNLLQAVRAINLFFQSTFCLTGVHRGFIHGSKPVGLAFPHPKWILGNNALVTAGYIADSSDSQIQALTSVNKVDLTNLIHDLSEFLVNTINPTPADSSILQAKICQISRDSLLKKPKRITENLQNACIQAWTTTVSGRIAGAKIFQECCVSSAFIRKPERFSNAELNAAIRLRGGVPDLRCLKHIARKHGSETCRLCGTHKESLGHVMGGCSSLKRLVTNRHDEVLRSIFLKLTSLNPDWNFELEPRPSTNVIHHKPDLVASHNSTRSVIVMDLTIRNESSFEAMKNAKQEKINNYEPLRQYYTSKGAQCFTVMPLWFGARGGTDKDTISFLTNKFNLTKPFLDDTSIYIFKRSLSLYFQVLHC